MVGVSRILAGSILVASVAVVVAWFAARHEIAGWLVERRLGSAVRDFVVEEVTLDRLVVTDIVLAQAAWVRRAEATWLTPRRDGTLTLGGLEMPWPDGSLALPDALPGNIVLEDARVAVSSPWGAVDLGLDARLANRPDGIAGSGRWRARFDGGSADGAVSLRLDRATGALQLEFTPRRIDHRHLVLGPPAGRIVVERRAGLDPDVRAWLEWPSVEAAGLALGTVTVEAAADASGLGGTLTIAREDSPVHGAVTFARTGAALELAGELAADLGTGNATVALAFEASLPEGGDPAGWTVEAEGAVETAGFRLAPWLAGGALRAPLALAMREGVARVWLDGPVALDVGSALLPAPASLRLPHRGAWLDARRGDDGWDLEAGIEGAGGTADGQALEFAAAGAGRLGPDGLALSLPRIDLALAGPRAAGSLEGSLSLDGSRGSWRANLGLVGLLETVQTDGAAAVNVAFDVPATMTFGEDGLSVATESSALVHVAELRAGPAVLGGLVVELPLHLSDLERGIEVRLTDTGWIDLMTFEHELLRTLGPTSIALQREALPMFVLELLGDDLSWDLRLKADGTPVNAALWPGGSRPVIAEGLLPDIGFRLESLGTRYLQATMEANGGDLRLRGPDLGFAGIRALVNYNSALSPWPQVSADIRRLEDLREPRRFGPLSFDVVSSPVWPEGDDARISVTAHSEAARFLGAVDAFWSPGKDRLEATVRTNGLDFDHRGLQPADLAPLHGSLFRDSRGFLGLAGRVWVDKGESGADLALTVDDASARFADLSFERLAGTATFSDVFPLATPGAQSFSIARLETPFPLHDVEVDVVLPGDGRILVDRATARLPSGMPFTAAAGGGGLLHLSGLDAASLLDPYGRADIALEGVLDGEVRVALGAGGLAVSGAHLRSVAPGTVTRADGNTVAFDELEIRAAPGEGPISSWQVTIGVDGCRKTGDFPLDDDIDALTGKIRSWLGDAGCGGR